MVSLSVYCLGFSLCWDSKGERQWLCLATEHVDSYAMLVDGCCGALAGDVHNDLRVVNRRDGSPRVEKVSDIGERNHDALSSAMNCQPIQ